MAEPPKTTPPAVTGPVSAALEADLRGWVRRQGVVVWLDLDEHYTAFVDGLITARKAGALPYDVRAFRGSHLALMRELEGLAGGTEKVPLVIHLPGFTEETVRQTPLLELYAAGVRYRKALDTLVTEAASGRVQQAQIAAFKAQPEMTLAGADAWLSTLINQTGGGLASQLRAMAPVAVLEDLLSGGHIAKHLGHADDAIWERFAAWTGLPKPWRETTLPAAAVSAKDMAFVAASWALCVEYVDDLKRAPVNPHLTAASGLPRPIVETCRTIAAHLRGHRPDFYQRTADETEALLLDEVETATAEDLGKIETFRFEEGKICEAALAALGHGDWDAAAEWAALRLDAKGTTGSFWLRESPPRQGTWQLVRAAARLGQAIAHAGERLGTGTKGGLEAALDAYTQRGAAVDNAHRHIEQRRAALLYPQVPEFEVLRARLDGLRTLWRRWADAWARDFNGLCRTNGFLPSAARQQRNLFDEVVRPMTQEAGPTAYFVVDALRYEMGAELYRQLVDTPATTVQLDARLAELPTVTEVGMNVLAPVARAGRLSPSVSSSGKVEGFSTGEFRVHDPETRKRAMHSRVGGATCPWLSLEEVVSRDSASLKLAVARARLVVVHSQEIDNAGEKGVGPSVFEHAMQKLRAAWRLLRDAGVRRFVITSDHGFLMLDDSARTAVAHGRKIDPRRRHVFSAAAADHAGEVRVALAALGYDGVDGYVMFPETTAVFDLGRRNMSFVHGGNSLQERVIPVLTIVHRAASGGHTMRYRLVGEAKQGVAGMHCVEAKIEVAAQGALDFGSAKELEVGLRAVAGDGAVQVELCQTRGDARLSGGAVVATVGAPFELFFRLAGSSEERALIELYHPSAAANVEPYTPEVRFAVAALGGSAGQETGLERATAGPERAASVAWLDRLPSGGVRQLFAHLEAHGTVTEGEAVSILGSPRAARRFAIKFDELAKMAPFGVRVESVAGIKRYVREGSGT